MVESDSSSRYELHLRHQLETNRHLENQAGRILRIWLAFFGAFLAFTSSITTLVLTDTVELPAIQFPDPSTQTSELASLPIIGEPVAQMIWLLIVILTGLLALTSLYYIIIQSPLSALRVLRPTVKPPYLEDYEDTNLDETFDGMYREQIKRNEQPLTETFDYWNSCTSSIFRGITLFAVSLLPISTLLLFYSPQTLLLSGIFASYVMFSTLLKVKDFRRFVFWYYPTDAGYLAGAVLSVIMFNIIIIFEVRGILEEIILGIILAFPAGVILVTSASIEKSKLADVLTRNIGIFTILFIFLFISLISIPFNSPLNILLNSLLALVLVTTIVLSILTSIFIAYVSVDKYQNFSKKSDKIQFIESRLRAAPENIKDRIHGDEE